MLVRFKFKSPEMMCSHCNRIVAKARIKTKKFCSDDIVSAKDMKATFLSHKQELQDGDEIICKRCYKRKEKKLEQLANRPWWKFW